jgi:ubiquinone/menaquinone biosynthesis C-methylase UbiE
VNKLSAISTHPYFTEVPVSESKFNPQYVIHSDEEPLRLERQAQIYGTADDLRFLAPRPSDRVLDAGCGSGSMTRAIARTIPNGQAIGLDRESRYIDFARRQAKSEQIENANFEVGDVLSIPFANGTFDLRWSKHLLQWVGQRQQALAEFKRVTRRGGRIVCCNFDRFCLAHYPTDSRLQVSAPRRN